MGIQQFENEGLGAIEAVLDNYSVIPPSLRTDKYIAEIINFVYQGTLIQKHETEISNELKRAAAAVILLEHIPINNEGYEAIGLLRDGILNNETEVKYNEGSKKNFHVRIDCY